MTRREEPEFYAIAARSYKQREGKTALGEFSRSVQERIFHPQFSSSLSDHSLGTN
jgi:hypothetical protein